MMMRAKGVTLAEIMETTRRQAHTVRGFVSIPGRKGGLPTLYIRSNSCQNTSALKRLHWFRRSLLTQQA